MENLVIEHVANGFFLWLILYYFPMLENIHQYVNDITDIFDFVYFTITSVWGCVLHFFLFDTFK